MNTSAIQGVNVPRPFTEIQVQTRSCIIAIINTIVLVIASGIVPTDECQITTILSYITVFTYIIAIMLWLVFLI